MINVKCKICNKSFKIRKSWLGKRGFFCSRNCYRKSDNYNIKRIKSLTSNKFLIKNCKICNKEFRVLLSQLNKKGRKNKAYCSRKCRFKDIPKGKKAYNWKGGKNIGKYIHLYVPYHPYKNKKNYILEHRLVMEASLNKITKTRWLIFCKTGNFPKNSKFLSKKCVVHHINGNTQDNRLKNLKLFNTNGEHLRYHFKSQKKIG